VIVYLDTSALAKRYIIEPDAESMNRLIAQNQGRLFTSIVTYAEILSVFARCWRQRRISSRQFRAQNRAFLAEWSALHVVDLSFQVIQPAGRVIERHRLRAYDAVQLCSALWLGRPVFATFDARLRQAAAAEGLPVTP
jgi:hypothetical protein